MTIHQSIRRFALASAAVAVPFTVAQAAPPLPDDFINDEVMMIAVFDLAQVNPGAIDATGRGVIEHIPEFGEMIGKVRADHEAFVNAGGRYIVIAAADDESDDLWAFLPFAGVFVDAEQCDEAVLTEIIRRHATEFTTEAAIERQGDWLLVFKPDRRKLTHRDEKDPLPEIPTVDPERAERFRTTYAALDGRSVGIMMIPTADVHREAEEEFAADMDGMEGMEGMEDSPIAIPYLLAGALAMHGWADLGHNPSVTGVVELADATKASQLATIVQSLPNFMAEQMAQMEEMFEGGEMPAEITLSMRVMQSITCVQAGSKVTVSIGQSKLRPILDLAGPILKKQRDEAREYQAASQSRQIGMALIMYASNHEDQWPDSLDALVEKGQMTREELDALLTHPTTGEKNAFKYVKPDKPMSELENPATTPVLYELKNGAIDPEGYIMYADGHVEKGRR